MKKLKFLAIGLTSILFLFSCSNNSENNDITDNTSNTVSISMELPSLSNSRAIGNIGNTGDKVKLEGTVMIHAKQSESGAIMNTFELAASDFFNNDGTSITKTLEVSSTATFIYAEGNLDNTTRNDDVNTRQGEATSSSVLVTGGKGITKGTGSANASCIIELAPEMARFEIVGTLGATTTISNLVINGIYLNNVKQKRDDATLVKSTKFTTPAWDVTYATSGAKSNLYTEFTPAISGMDANKSDGYNFFAQGSESVPATKEDAIKVHPHIIMNVSYTDNAGTAVNGVYLNICAFRNTGNSYFQNFEAGKIYQLNLADVTKIIDIINPPVTPDPDPDAVAVDITLSVKNWEIIIAKPEV